ncbi:MAG: aldehyde dehydrogenase family protein [Myxococcales bacterium]|nr:aldehyde dehydrogenase family protein [Myxococcales bacterium]
MSRVSPQPSTHTTAAAAAVRITAINPATGADTGWTVDGADPASLAGIVDAARFAGAAFAAAGLDVRKKAVRSLGNAILGRAAEIGQILHEELGKPLGEAWTSELVTTGELFDYWLAAIDDLLSPIDVPLNPINYPGKQVWLELDPVGVIALIMPWNYPFNLPLRTIVPGLLAGNAVVFKPSEHAPRTGAILAELLAATLPANLVTTVQGDGRVGEALIAAHPDKVVFTGSVGAGKRVALQAATMLIPCSLELGSKDAAIVLADANLDRAVAGIVWGAFHNAGQDCASIERCYVHRSIYETFVDRVVTATRALREGDDVGPLVNAAALDKVHGQVQAAKAAGAMVRTGGEPSEKGYFYPPTVLTDVPEGCDLMVEETFGPLLPIVPFDTVDEAILLTNRTPFGLCGSVWGKDVVAAEAVARRIRCGVIFVNNCCFTGPMGGAAWTGRGDSGYGVTGSRFGLEGLTQVRTVCIDRTGQKREMWWYPYNDALVRMATGLIEVSRGGASLAQRARGVPMALGGLMGRWK